MRRQNNFGIAMSPDPFPVYRFGKGSGYANQTLSLRVWASETTYLVMKKLVKTQLKHRSRAKAVYYDAKKAK